MADKSKPQGARRVIHAFGHSLNGLQAAFRREAALRQEIALSVLLIPTALWLGHTPAERALLMGVVLLVLIVELLNAALEAAIDRIGEEYHELAGLAKDMASAAVLVSFILLAVVWSIILQPRFF